MNYEVKNIMEGTKPIKSLYDNDTGTLKTYILYCHLTFIIQGIGMLITVYGFLFELNLDEYICCAIVFFGSFQGMLGIWILLFRGKIIANIKDELQMWSIDSAGEEIHSRIKLQIKIVTVFILLIFSAVLYGIYLFNIPLPADEDFLYVLRFVKEYFPDQEDILVFIYRASCPLLGYAMIVQAYQFIYYVQHLKFQIIMCINFMANIGVYDPKIDDVLLIYNEEYQRVVKSRLIFCIRRYSEFLSQVMSYVYRYLTEQYCFRVQKTKVAEMSVMIILCSISVCLLGISIMLYLLLAKFYPEYYTRMAIMSLVTITAFGGVIISGQSIENQSTKAAIAICEVPWYNFNQNNKRIYLIFLQNLLMHSWKIKFSEKYSVNYDLGLGIVKGICSVGSVMINMRF